MRNILLVMEHSEQSSSASCADVKFDAERNSEEEASDCSSDPGLYDDVDDISDSSSNHDADESDPLNDASFCAKCTYTGRQIASSLCTMSFFCKQQIFLKSTVKENKQLRTLNSEYGEIIHSHFSTIKELKLKLTLLEDELKNRGDLIKALKARNNKIEEQNSELKTLSKNASMWKTKYEETQCAVNVLVEQKNSLSEQINESLQMAKNWKDAHDRIQRQANKTKPLSGRYQNTFNFDKHLSGSSVNEFPKATQSVDLKNTNHAVYKRGPKKGLPKPMNNGVRDQVPDRSLLPNSKGSIDSDDICAGTSEQDTSSSSYVAKRRSTRISKKPEKFEPNFMSNRSSIKGSTKTATPQTNFVIEIMKPDEFQYSKQHQPETSQIYNTRSVMGVKTLSVREQQAKMGSVAAKIAALRLENQKSAPVEGSQANNSPVASVPEKIIIDEEEDRQRTKNRRSILDDLRMSDTDEEDTIRRNSICRPNNISFDEDLSQEPQLQVEQITVDILERELDRTTDAEEESTASSAFSGNVSISSQLNKSNHDIDETVVVQTMKHSTIQSSLKYNTFNKLKVQENNGDQDISTSTHPLTSTPKKDMSGLALKEEFNLYELQQSVKNVPNISDKETSMKRSEGTPPMKRSESTSNPFCSSFTRQISLSESSDSSAVTSNPRSSAIRDVCMDSPCVSPCATPGRKDILAHDLALSVSSDDMSPARDSLQALSTPQRDDHNVPSVPDQSFIHSYQEMSTTSNHPIKDVISNEETIKETPILIPSERQQSPEVIQDAAPSSPSHDECSVVTSPRKVNNVSAIEESCPLQPTLAPQTIKYDPFADFLNDSKNRIAEQRKLSPQKPAKRPNKPIPIMQKESSEDFVPKRTPQRPRNSAAKNLNLVKKKSETVVQRNLTLTSPKKSVSINSSPRDIQISSCDENNLQEFNEQSYSTTIVQVNDGVDLDDATEEKLQIDDSTLMNEGEQTSSVPKVIVRASCTLGKQVEQAPSGSLLASSTEILSPQERRLQKLKKAGAAVKMLLMKQRRSLCQNDLQSVSHGHSKVDDNLSSHKEPQSNSPVNSHSCTKPANNIAISNSSDLDGGQPKIQSAVENNEKLHVKKIDRPSSLSIKKDTRGAIVHTKRTTKEPEIVDASPETTPKTHLAASKVISNRHYAANKNTQLPAPSFEARKLVINNVQCINEKTGKITSGKAVNQTNVAPRVRQQPLQKSAASIDPASGRTRQRFALPKIQKAQNQLPIKSKNSELMLLSNSREISQNFETYKEEDNSESLFNVKSEVDSHSDIALESASTDISHPKLPGRFAESSSTSAKSSFPVLFEPTQIVKTPDAIRTALFKRKFVDSNKKVESHSIASRPKHPVNGKASITVSGSSSVRPLKRQAQFVDIGVPPPKKAANKQAKNERSQLESFLSQVSVGTSLELAMNSIDCDLDQIIDRLGIATVAFCITQAVNSLNVGNMWAVIQHAVTSEFIAIRRSYFRAKSEQAIIEAVHQMDDDGRLFTAVFERICAQIIAAKDASEAQICKLVRVAFLALHYNQSLSAVQKEDKAADLVEFLFLERSPVAVASALCFVSLNEAEQLVKWLAHRKSWSQQRRLIQLAITQTNPLFEVVFNRQIPGFKWSPISSEEVLHFFNEELKIMRDAVHRLPQLVELRQSNISLHSSLHNHLRFAVCLFSFRHAIQFDRKSLFDRILIQTITQLDDWLTGSSTGSNFMKEIVPPSLAAIADVALLMIVLCALFCDSGIHATHAKQVKFGEILEAVRQHAVKAHYYEEQCRSSPVPRELHPLLLGTISHWRKMLSVASRYSI